AALINDARKRYLRILECLSALHAPGTDLSVVAVAVRDAALRRLPAARKGANAPKPGLKPTDPDLPAKVAAVYKAAWERGEPPRKAVAEAFGVTSSKGSHMIEAAREEGLLAAAPGQGKAGLKGRPRKRPKEGT
ncbi:MAG: hypothetical protein ABI869_03810, partial [Actinomycetota bacterium]